MRRSDKSGPATCVFPHLGSWPYSGDQRVSSLKFTGASLVSPGRDDNGRLGLSGGERARYLANIAGHRPFQLELLRWNHARTESDDLEEVDQAAAYTQLNCLTGNFRYTIDGNPGRGIKWCPLEMAGVFVRHRGASALLWLPEGGPNPLARTSLGGPWTLVEFAELERQRVVIDKTRILQSADVQDVAAYAEVSMLRQVHDRPRLRDAEPHLTDAWLEASEDLRTLWTWDWRPVRDTSPFEVAQAKFVYSAKYPIADTFRGFYGEVRWQWRWVEDGTGCLAVRNHIWPLDVQIILSEEGMCCQGPDGEIIPLDP